MEIVQRLPAHLKYTAMDRVLNVCTYFRKVAMQEGTYRPPRTGKFIISCMTHFTLICVETFNILFENWFYVDILTYTWLHHFSSCRTRSAACRCRWSWFSFSASARSTSTSTGGDALQFRSSAWHFRRRWSHYVRFSAAVQGGHVPAKSHPVAGHATRCPTWCEWCVQQCEPRCVPQALARASTASGAPNASHAGTCPYSAQRSQRLQ